MKREYEEKIQEFKKLLKSENMNQIEDELWDLEIYLIEENSFENPLDRSTAETITERQQRVSLDIFGGYPLWSEVSFEVEGDKYTVIAYGASGENGGEDAIFDILFIKEDNEIKK